MISDKEIKKIQKELAKILSFKNDSEKLEFEIGMLNSDIMDYVEDLMKKKGIKTRKELAKKLKVSESFLSQLFSGDKKINLETLAKLQRIFNERFKLITKNEDKRKDYHVIVLKEKNKVISTNYINANIATVKDSNKVIELPN